MEYDYEALSVIFKLKPDRILDIALAEEADRRRRIPVIHGLQINDQIETFLENPDYNIVNRRPVWQAEE